MPNKLPSPKAGGGLLLQFRKNKQADAECLYTDVDATLLRDAVDAVTRMGAAIMFGKTSDGGAYSVMLLDGNEKVREYPHGAEELGDMLRRIVQTYQTD